jgi:three-Cys-motif partner protein
MSAQHLLEVRAHSRKKYSIVRKYLNACKIFSNVYQNFAYVDTHGGTGQVIDLETKEIIDASVLTAAKLQPSFPCYVVEIDPDNYNVLRRATSKFPNVTLFLGDCNEKIDEILGIIPKGQKFIFCFLDPDGLVYHGKNFICHQLRDETVEKIAKFPRTEVLINVPILAIMRDAGYIQSYPEAPSSIKMEGHITVLFGTDRWKTIDPGDYKSFGRLYISERLEQRYKYKGAILIRSVLTRGPLYYLVYGSNSERGGEIMRDIMKKEWVDTKGGQYPISRYSYSTDKEWLNVEYPLNLFIFED